MEPTTDEATLPLGDQIALLAARVDVGEHRLLTCIRRFDQSEEWGRQGARSCADWLSWRVGVGLGIAREKVRVARALGQFPAIDAAMATGRLSYAKVRAVTRVATASTEQRLVDLALAATGAQLERICRRFRGAPGASGESVDDARGVRVRATDGGLMRIEVTLDPVEAAMVLQAIEKMRDELRAGTGTTNHVSAETHNRDGRLPTPGRADGVIAMAERVLAGDSEGRDAAVGGDRALHQVIVHLDQAVLGPDGAREAFLDDGTSLPAETFRRVACDSALLAVTTGESGAMLDVGRKTRAIPAAVRRALWSRDGGCRFPMCSNRRFVDAHHVHHWVHGGGTSLDNLVLLCGFHHRLLHDGGFRMSLDGDGDARFFSSAGQEIHAVPPPLEVARPTMLELALMEDPDVNLCGWDGEPVDYDAALDALFVAAG